MTISLCSHLPPVGITGLGHALPATIRDNQDPVFAELRTEDRFGALFSGYGSRRVLARGESLSELMANACRAALADGLFSGSAIDLLTGFASVSEFLAPNELYSVHRQLGMAPGAEVVPIADEFTTFLSGLRLAANRIWLGQDQAALVVCGCRWSSNIDYRDPVSASIGDGAGAALVERLVVTAQTGLEQGGLGQTGPGRTAAPGTATERTTPRFRLLGWNSEVPAGMYGVMRLAPRSEDVPTTLTDFKPATRPLFNMLMDSEPVFRDWGTSAPPRIALELVQAAGVDPRDVTCIGHQASAYLLDAWRSALAPMQLQDTLKSHGNMTLASVPVTLCLRAPLIQTRFVLLLGLGLGIHAAACLMERQ